MLHEASSLSPEKRAAAELLLGRPLSDRETLNVQAFEVPEVSPERKLEVAQQLRELFAEVNENLSKAPPEDSNEVFEEAMQSSRPNFRAIR